MAETRLMVLVCEWIEGPNYWHSYLLFVPTDCYGIDHIDGVWRVRNTVLEDTAIMLSMKGTERADVVQGLEARLREQGAEEVRG